MNIPFRTAHKRTKKNPFFELARAIVLPVCRVFMAQRVTCGGFIPPLVRAREAPICLHVPSKLLYADEGPAGYKGYLLPACKREVTV